MDVMSKEQGALELTLMNAERSEDNFEAVLLEGLNLGIPAEIMTRLESIWTASKTIAGEIIAIGKIIVSSIFDFLRAHPGIMVGMALGAAVAGLSSGIPLLGGLLAPLLGKLTMIYGAGVGAAHSNGILTADPLVALISLAQKFFELLRTIFVSVTEYFQKI